VLLIFLVGEGLILKPLPCEAVLLISLQRRGDLIYPLQASASHLFRKARGLFKSLSLTPLLRKERGISFLE